MQERGDGAFLIESALRGESERVDAAQIAIKPVLHQIFDCRDAIRVGRLPEDTKQGFGFTHRRSPSNPKARNVVIAARRGKEHRLSRRGHFRGTGGGLSG